MEQKMRAILFLFLILSLPFSLFANELKGNDVIVIKYPNGKTKNEQQTKNGLPDGLSISYDEEGNVTLRQLYKKGFLALEKEFYKSGKLARETAYNSKGEQHGDNKTFYESGRLKTREKYRSGLLYGVERRYMEDGAILVNIVWKDGEAKAGKCANGRKLTKEELATWKDKRTVDCNKQADSTDSKDDDFDELFKEMGDK